MLSTALVSDRKLVTFDNFEEDKDSYKVTLGDVMVDFANISAEGVSDYGRGKLSLWSINGNFYFPVVSWSRRNWEMYVRRNRCRSYLLSSYSFPLIRSNSLPCKLRLACLLRCSVGHIKRPSEFCYVVVFY